MVDQKREVAYIFGILSIVIALFIPLAGIILGIIGLFQNKRDNSRKAKIMNIIGIVLGTLLFIATLVITYMSVSLLPTA